MLPEHRLGVILDQFKDSQTSNCLFHTSLETPSLYSDHICERSQFPSEVALELDGKNKEIWQVAFSPDGTRLACCGSDPWLVIWDTETFGLLHDINAHGAAEICNISWSPDSKMIVTCGRDHYAKVWNAEVTI